MTFAADNLVAALYAHRTLKAYANEGVEYVWVKQHPLGPRYLLVNRRFEHLYRKKDSLGVDRDIWEEAVRMGIQDVVIVYRKGGEAIVYKAAITVWYMLGFVVDSYSMFKPQTQLQRSAMEILEPHDE